MDIQNVVREWLSLTYHIFTLMSGKPSHTLQDHLLISASVAQAASDAMANFFAIVALQLQLLKATSKQTISIFMIELQQCLCFMMYNIILAWPMIKKLGFFAPIFIFHLVFILFLGSQVNCLYPNKPSYKIRQIIDMNNTFSMESNVTVVFSSCGGLLDLKQSILSFFYYNTYPLKKLILVDRCSTPQLDLRNCLPQKNSQFPLFFRIISFTGSQIEGLQKAFQEVDTKYVFNTGYKWITFDGLGYIQQAIDAIQYGQSKDVKISQVTSLFPSWKNYRSLSKYMKTVSGTTFYEIRSFKPTNKYYFTLNPSLMDFEAVFNKTVNRNFREFCVSHFCRGVTDRDCCERQIGRQLYQNKKYIQVFIDDGTVQAKVFQID